MSLTSLLPNFPCPIFLFLKVRILLYAYVARFLAATSHCIASYKAIYSLLGENYSLHLHRMAFDGRAYLSRAITSGSYSHE